MELDVLYEARENEAETRQRFSNLNREQCELLWNHLHDRLRLYQRIRTRITLDLWTIFINWANDRNHYPAVYSSLLETGWEAKTANLHCMYLTMCMSILHERVQYLQGQPLLPSPPRYQQHHGSFARSTATLLPSNSGDAGSSEHGGRTGRVGGQRHGGASEN